MENTNTNEVEDKELEEIIDTLREQGYSDEDILTFFEDIEKDFEANQANPEGDEPKKDDEPVVEPLNLMEITDAVANKEPARVAAMFDAAIKDRLADMVDERKKLIAQSMFTDPDPEDEDEEEVEIEDDDSDDDSEEGEVDENEHIPFPNQQK